MDSAVTSEQQLVMQAVYDHLRQHADWPAFGAIDRPLRRQLGSDPALVIRNLPSSLLVHSGTGYPRSDDRVCLTLLGVSRCSGGRDDVDRFLAAIRHMAEVEECSDPPANEPDWTPRISSDDFRRFFGIENDDAAVGRLYALFEINRYGISSSVGNGSFWYLSIDRAIHYFANAHNVADYLAARKAWEIDALDVASLTQPLESREVLAAAAKAGRGRRMRRWRRLLRLPDVQRLPTLEQEIARINESGAFDEKVLIVTADVLLLCVAISSVVLGMTADVTRSVPWVGVVVGLLIATPPILQVIDALWSNVATRRYREWAGRVAHQYTRVIRRRRLARVLARYGRQEMAQRQLPPDEASYYSVASTRLRRHRWKLIAAGVAITTAVALGLLWLPIRPDNRYYRLGQAFSLGRGFEVSVVSNAQCPSEYDSQGPYCSISLRFRNTTSFRQGIGSGSFGVIRPSGSVAYDHQDYAIGVTSGGNYYDYRDATFPPPYYLQPGEERTVVFVFDVPSGVVLDEVLLTARGSAGRVHVLLASA